MMVLATNMVATRTSAQDLVIDHLDGTATIVTLEEAHLGMVIDKSSWHEPMIGHYTYLNIGVDMADMRLVDSVELLQGVADPGYVQEVFRIAAGTGAYDGIVASFKYDSYGAFVLESDFMGVYQSTFEMEQPGCNAGLLEDAARQVRRCRMTPLRGISISRPMMDWSGGSRSTTTAERQVSPTWHL